MAKEKRKGRKVIQLSPKQKKEVEQAIRRARARPDLTSAQDTIPYQIMWPDGLCLLEDGKYSRSILFHDINYQIVSMEERKISQERLKEFYNSFDHTVRMQFTFLNHVSDQHSWKSNLKWDGLPEDVQEIGRESSDILKEKMAYGSNGRNETMMLTLTVEARDEKDARQKFRQLERDAMEKLNVMGVNAQALNGKERLIVLHSIFHPYEEPLRFDWNYLPASGLSTKDFIAPSSFTFKDGKQFLVGDTICRVSYLQITCVELSDRFLSKLMQTENGILINMHIQSIDTAEAMKMVKRKMSDLDAMKIQQQKNATRGGYDKDILPPELVSYGDDVRNLFQILSQKNEKLFQLTFLIMNFARNKKTMKNAVAQAASIAQEPGCKLVCLDYQQEDGMVSSLPLGLNRIKIQRSLNTSSLALFVPFMTQELFQQGEAIYYGINALSGNLIMADRKKLMNPNGLILGSSGGGKSFAAKREIVYTFFATDDMIRILDPEGEYGALVEALHGQIIKISPNSGHYINPMDINLDYSDEDSPLALKSDFILSFCETIAGGKNGLGPVEKSVIDRAVHRVYIPYFEHPVPENMPILADLHREILQQPEPEAARIASALELYVSGSQNIFNHRTNVDVHNRLVSFDIKELGKQLKVLGMLIIQDQIWNLVNLNRAEGRSTRYYVDEFHLLLKGEIASWSVEIWKRFRKWDGIPTGITQNVQDLFQSPEIESIFENSDFIYLLSQGPKDRERLSEMLHISEYQMRYIDSSRVGEGLLFFGSTVLPFMDQFPKDTKLYQIFSTKPSDTKAAAVNTANREREQAEATAFSAGSAKNPDLNDYMDHLSELFEKELEKREEPKQNIQDWFPEDPAGYEPDADIVFKDIEF